MSRKPESSKAVAKHHPNLAHRPPPSNSHSGGAVALNTAYDGFIAAAALDLAVKNRWEVHEEGARDLDSLKSVFTRDFSLSLILRQNVGRPLREEDAVAFSWDVEPGRKLGLEIDHGQGRDYLSSFNGVRLLVKSLQRGAAKEEATIMFHRNEDRGVILSVILDGRPSPVDIMCIVDTSNNSISEFFEHVDDAFDFGHRVPLPLYSWGARSEAGLIAHLPVWSGPPLFLSYLSTAVKEYNRGEPTTWESFDKLRVLIWARRIDPTVVPMFNHQNIHRLFLRLRPGHLNWLHDFAEDVYESDRRSSKDCDKYITWCRHKYPELTAAELSRLEVVYGHIVNELDLIFATLSSAHPPAHGPPPAPHGRPPPPQSHPRSPTPSPERPQAGQHHRAPSTSSSSASSYESDFDAGAPPPAHTLTAPAGHDEPPSRRSHPYAHATPSPRAEPHSRLIPGGHDHGQSSGRSGRASPPHDPSSHHAATSHRVPTRPSSVHTSSSDEDEESEDESSEDEARPTHTVRRYKVVHRSPDADDEPASSSRQPPPPPSIQPHIRTVSPPPRPHIRTVSPPRGLNEPGPSSSRRKGKEPESDRERRHRRRDGESSSKREKGKSSKDSKKSTIGAMFSGTSIMDWQRRSDRRKDRRREEERGGGDDDAKGKGREKRDKDRGGDREYRDRRRERRDRDEDPERKKRSSRR